MVEGIDLTIESLKEKLNEIRLKVSECRKKGFYTKIAEIKLMAIPSKIKMVEITRDYKDLQKITSMLDDARNEILSVEKEGLNSESNRLQ